MEIQEENVLFLGFEQVYKSSANVEDKLQQLCHFSGEEIIYPICICSVPYMENDF